jgi:hypothetical protein
MIAFAASLIASAQDAPGLEPDWATLGLVLAVVGSFLLGNAILFRHPRDLVRERFAASLSAPSSARVAPLLGIRGQIFHRLQISTGFFYLVLGFAMQLVGRFRPLKPGTEPAFPVFWIAVMALATAALLVLGWWWSSRSFRRHVRAHLLRNPPEFEADMAFAREVGELFGVESHPEDSVESYVGRLRTELKLPALSRHPARAPRSPFQADVDIDLD